MKNNKLNILEKIMEETDDVIYAKDVDGRYLLLNSAASRYLKSSKRQALGKNDFEFMSETDAKKITRGDKELLATGESSEYGEKVRINGVERSFLTTKSPYKDKKGNVIGSICIAKDITEKRLEEKLREKSEKLKAVITNAPLALFSADRDGTITTFIGKALKGLKKKWGENVGESIFDVYRDSPEILEAFRRAIKGEETTVTLVSSPNEPRIFETTFSPQEDQKGSISGVIAVSTDITLRKHIENSLRESRKKLEEAQKIARMGDWIMDISSDRIYGSDEAWRLFGLPPQKNGISQDVFYNYPHPEDREFVRQAHKEAITQKKSYDIEYRAILPGAKERIFHGQGEVITDKSGKPVALHGTVQDITKRKKTEQMLRASEDKFAKAFRSSPDAIVISTLKNGVIIETNTGFTKLFGYHQEEVVGKTSYELKIWTKIQDRDRLVRTIKSGSNINNIEIDFRTKSGDIHHTLLSADVIQIEDKPHLLMIIHDMTKHRRKEEIFKSLAVRFTSIYGREFFDRISAHVLEMLGADYAYVGKLKSNKREISVIGGTDKKNVLEHIDFNLEGTPSAEVVGRRACLFPSKVQERFPDDKLLVGMDIEGYAGVPLNSRSGKPIGIFVVLNKNPIIDKQLALSMLSIYSARISAEIERIETEEMLRQKDRDIRKAYADVFSAITNEKLLILTPDEIATAQGDQQSETFVVASAEQLVYAREFLRKKLRPLLCDNDLSDMILASGEAITNGVKHSFSCKIQVFNYDDTVQIKISDDGPGIDFSVLPKATLLAGFSTKKSLGMGFAVILEICDRVLLSTGPQGTNLLLEIDSGKEAGTLDDVLAR